MHWIALQPKTGTETGTGADTEEGRGPLMDAPLSDAATACAWWALQFTPLVARIDGVLLLEVSASQRLFGGAGALQQQLFEPNGPLSLVEYAHGATSLIAVGRLRCGQSLAPDALPLHTLAAAQAHLPTLARLGLATWGQLRALPRGGLVRRFGAHLVDTLDRAYGMAPEVYPWLTLPDVFDAPLELAASVESAPALLFGARRLLAQLQVWLRARQRGVLALELLWELDARRSNALHVDAHHTGDSQGRLVLRTAQPTQDMVHLGRLLGEQLARVRLPAPVLHVRMRSLQTQAMRGESASLLPDEVRKGDSLHQLLERLGARLGPLQVLRARLQADHRPERMQCWSGMADAPLAKGGCGAIESGATRAMPTGARCQKNPQFCKAAYNDSAAYPTWLLATPQRLAVHQGQPHYQGLLTLLLGPQRLEVGWLEGNAGCALRDYFVARSAVAGLVWVYRERLGGAEKSAPQDALGWFLHGLFA